MEILTFCTCPTCGHHKEDRMIFTKEELSDVLVNFVKFIDIDISSVQLKFSADEFVKSVLEAEEKPPK